MTFGCGVKICKQKIQCWIPYSLDDTEAMLYKPAVPNVEDGISLEAMNATESVLLADDRH